MELNDSNMNTMKLAATQNVLKNKFSKAYANRLEGENNLEEAMQPLLIGILNDETSVPLAKHSPPMRSMNVDNREKKSGASIQNIDKFYNDPNELCEMLRKKLLKMLEGDVKQADMMYSIIMRLRELEIIL